MKRTLRSLLIGGAAFVCLSGTAHAVVLPSATITETIGDYTVDNTSPSVWYIYAFSVTYGAGAINPQTTQPGWSACVTSASDICTGGGGYFYYYNSAVGTNNTTDDIAPGVTSSLFTFDEIVPNTDYVIYFTNTDEQQIISGSTTTPLPAALPLFASGLGAMGLFGCRKKRKNAAAIAA